MHFVFSLAAIASLGEYRNLTQTILSTNKF